MKTFLVLIAAIVLLYSVSADTISDDDKFETVKDVQESTDDKSHEISDFDNEHDEDISDLQDLGNEMTDSKEDNDDVINEGKVIKTEGLTIGVGEKGTITISLTGGAAAAKTSYIRYGRNTCRRGAKLLYNGYVGGSSHSHKGDGVNYLCMPKFPRYISTVAPSSYSLLYGSEYESHNRIYAGTHDFNVPCAVCEVPKASKMMIPAKVTCPKGWTREYYGYMMTEHYSHPRSSTYECMDFTPEKIPGSKRNTNGALFYFVQAQCNVGLPCGPYITNRALTCVICSA